MNVQVDTLYRYDVRAYNAAGAGEWGMASVRLPIPVPNAPTGLVGVAEDSGNIDLTWTAPAAFPPVTTVRVDRLINGAFVRVFEAGPSVTRYDEQSLTAATRYYFRVCSVNSYGQACTSTIGVTTPADQPGAPTLDKPSSTRTSITLRWNPTASTQLGYILQRHNGTSYADAARVASASTEGTIANLAPNTPHKVRVCAIFSGGARGCSAGLTVTTNP